MRTGTVCELPLVSGDGDGDGWPRLQSDGQFVGIVVLPRRTMVEMAAVKGILLKNSLLKEVGALHSCPLRFPRRSRTSQTHQSPPPRCPSRTRSIRTRLNRRLHYLAPPHQQRHLPQALQS